VAGGDVTSSGAQATRPVIASAIAGANNLKFEILMVPLVAFS
jgi:hypothetical protein